MSEHPSPTEVGPVEAAMRLREAGHDAQAEQALKRILARDPAHLHANEQLLDLLLGAGRLDDVETHARATIARDDTLAYAWVFLAIAQLNRGQDALATCMRAVAVGEDDARTHDCLGVALMRAGRRDDAQESFRRALALQPDAAAIHLRLGELLRDMGRLEDAAESHRTAVRLEPRLIHARCNLALILDAMGRHGESQQELQHVLRDVPDFLPAQSALAAMHIERQQWAQAEAATRRVLELDPTLAGAHFDLATILYTQMRDAEAMVHLDEAVRLDPDNGVFRSSRVTRTLPRVPRTEAQAHDAPAAFDDALRRYADWRASCRARDAHVRLDTVSMVPFLLAYRDGNHVDRLSRFADEMGPPRTFVAARKAGTHARLRLGIVSQHFRRHSVWDVITKGILFNLDRDRFDVHLYHTGTVEDGETAYAKSVCDRWLDTRSVYGASRWAAAIEKDRPDVLFYPELGMDLTTWLLGRERLAPVQAVGWGHPITSGLSTMDLYLSGELFEPPDADAHYRERLVRLPGVGACTTALALPDDPPRDVLDALAARAGPTLLVPQMPFKFDPRFDRQLARTVRAIGPCTVVIPVDATHETATAQLLARLGAALRAQGVDPDATLMRVPWLHQAQFNALLDATDAMLECPFSGYTTAWLAVHRGTPVVSMTGPFLRHRLTTGLHRRLGITDTIVEDPDAYVRVAAAVALEGRASDAGRARRAAIRAAAPRVDGDVSVVRAVEQAFLQALEECAAR